MKLPSRHPLAWTVAALLAFAIAVSGLAGFYAPADVTDLVYTEKGYVVRECDRLQYFSDEPQLVSHLEEEQEMRDNLNVWWGGGPGWFRGGGGPPMALGSFDSTEGFSFSGTNVQVEGVDELDIVKTDGTFVYATSGEEVVIVRAYPPEDAGVVARFTPDARPSGLFIDGTRLAVFGETWGDWRNETFHGPEAIITVYDVSDPAAPALVREVRVEGSRVGARLVDGHAYAVLTHYAYLQDGGVILPLLDDGGAARRVAAPEVGYFRDSPYGSGLTLVLAVDLHSDADVTLATYLTGYVGELYVTPRTVYMAGFVYRETDEDSMEGRTAIHAVDFDGLTVHYACSAEVPGSLLDQFSMDEFEGNLRVATTVNQWGWGPDEMSSGVYVLDSSLRLLGSVEGIGAGETMHSVRFLGDRAYMVTFEKIDPFFVLDLSDPAAPAVLGELEIPGFSDYLHPWGPDYVIGVGLDAHDMGDFSWFQGVKVALFDVSDPMNPWEVANVIVGDRGSETEVRADHHAFLLIPLYDYLVLPILEAEAPPGDPSNYGTPVYQGAFVYRVSEDGFSEEARISHGAEGDLAWEQTLHVRRSFHIEDVLYTVSQDLLRMTDLGTLGSLGDVAF